MVWEKITKTKTDFYYDVQTISVFFRRPTNLQVVWTRRSRRVVSWPLAWNPVVDPLVGNMRWPLPDNHSITVTLFKDSRTHEMEDKDWTFVLEDVSSLGKKRALATASINMKRYASIESTQQTFLMTFRPITKKITAAEIELTISCVFLREGKATWVQMKRFWRLFNVSFILVMKTCKAWSHWWAWIIALTLLHLMT